MILPNIYKDWALALNKEILDDAGSKWYHPFAKVGGDGTGDFYQGRMKFVNRNLNYFYFLNMLRFAVKGDYQYNSNFSKALEFSNFIRNDIAEQGPFGRMCVWKIIPRGRLKPHVDKWRYHKQIHRYIFFVSEHESPTVEVTIENKPVEVKQGMLLKFFPAINFHSFVNNSDSDWYFIGIDFWNLDRLQESIDLEKFNIDVEIPYQDGFGILKHKYISKE